MVLERKQAGGILGHARQARAALTLLCMAAAAAASAQTQVTVDLVSISAHDGRVSATAAGGGLVFHNDSDSSGDAIRIGDVELLFFADQGYRSILSFPTNQIPANATIDAASLFITRGTSQNNTGPLGQAFFGVKTGAFSGRPDLESQDFNEPADANGGALNIGASSGSQSSTTLAGAALAAVNRSGGADGGITQVRLQYPVVSNNDGNIDYIGFFPGNAVNPAQRPFLRVTYTLPPETVLNVTPGNLNFYDDDVDGVATVAQSLTITNVSASDVNIASVGLSGLHLDEFAIILDSGETPLHAGDTRTLDIVFNANVPAGAKEATVTITSDATGTPVLTVPITGNAVDRRATVGPPSLDFGTQIIENGPSASLQVVITNIGTSPLDVDSVLIGAEGTSGSPFSIVGDTGEPILAGGASRTLDIAFDPDFPAAPKSDTLHIITDASNQSAFDIPLTGIGASLGRRQFGDFDDSGCTDVNDYFFLLDHWQEDLNGTPIAVGDFLNLLDNWQSGPAC